MRDDELDELLAGLDADPWERQQLAEALDEIAGAPGSYDPDGPWHDGIPQLDDAFAAMDRANALNGQRIGEDIVAQLDRRPSAEDRVQRALVRIESGTYHEPSQPDPLGGRQDVCGDLDDFGRCGAAYHVRGCHQTVEASAATGDADAAAAWRDVLLNRTPDPGILGFANGEPGLGDDIWSDLLASPLGGQGAAVREQVLAYLGEPGGRPQPVPAWPSRQPRPDTSALRAELGL